MSRKRKDPRGFINIVTGYFDSPKIDALMESFPTAVFMHIRSMMYAGEHLTDGHVPPGKMKRQVSGSDDDVEALLDSGLWHEAGHGCRDCPQPAKGMIYVHDYLEHNRAKDDAQQESKQKSDAGKKGASVRWGDRNGIRTGKVSAVEDAPF